MRLYALPPYLAGYLLGSLITGCCIVASKAVGAALYARKADWL